MKILHTYNTANVASILAKEQRKRGHTVKVLMFEQNDTFLFREYGGLTLIKSSKYVKAVVDEAVKGRYDIIHIHSNVNVLDCLKYALLDTPIVLHYHGHDVKNHSKYIEDNSDIILCSLPTLVKPGFIYLPIPIDLSHWENNCKTGNKAFWFMQWNKFTWNEKRLEVMERMIDVGLDCKIIERWKHYIPYMTMQETYYNRFGVCVEYKDFVDYSKGLSLSVTALESLACGLSVYYLVEDRFINEFPMKHSVENVVDVLDKIYLSVLK